MKLIDKNILITGAARRIGKIFALAAAKEGARVILHHGHSPDDARKTKETIDELGGEAIIIQRDLGELENVKSIIELALLHGPLYGLVNNAAIFEPLNWTNCDLPSWNRHIAINLTAPFLLSQAFAKTIIPGKSGRIINILDWRALRPGNMHLPYTISKAGLLALTKSLAISLAPNITVNGLALGAILPPADGSDTNKITDSIPFSRWAKTEEIERAFLFLLEEDSYITGEVIHVDGGRHLI